jgi:anti-sigma factor RsiW
MSEAREHEEDRFALALMPYLRGELGEAERASLEAHLASCAACRDTLAAFRGVLSALRSGAYGPPELDWRRYRAELFAKRETRGSRVSWWTMPRLVPIVAAAIASLALVITLHGGLGGKTADDDMPIFEQTALGSRLDLLNDYGAIENLDLLENLDLVQELDDTTSVGEG